MVDGLVLYSAVAELKNEFEVYICMLHYTLPLLLGLIIDWKIDNSYGI